MYDFPMKKCIKSLNKHFMMMLINLYYVHTKYEIYASFQEENVVDILQFILDLMCEKPMAIIMALDRLEGIR